MGSLFMSLISFLKKFSIIIFVILALILSRSGFSYLLLLVLIGLIVSYINKRKREAIITGVLYALVGYILSYPAGLILNDYMPSIDIPVQTNAISVGMALLMGALIPVCFAIIICTITALIGSNLAKYVDEKLNRNADKTESNENQYIFTQENDNSYNHENNIEHKEELLNLTPIHKAKLRKKIEKIEEDNDD